MITRDHSFIFPVQMPDHIKVSFVRVIVKKHGFKLDLQLSAGRMTMELSLLRSFIILISLLWTLKLLGGFDLFIIFDETVYSLTGFIAIVA